MLLVSHEFVISLLFCVSPYSIDATVYPRRSSDASDLLSPAQLTLFSFHRGILFLLEDCFARAQIRCSISARTSSGLPTMLQRPRSSNPIVMSLHIVSTCLHVI